MNIEKLLKQRTELENQIREAERLQKAKPKFEKIMADSLTKHPDILSCDPQILKKSLDEFLAGFAGNLANRQR